MKNELIIKDTSFKLVDGRIQFPDYERLMAEATEVSHYVKNIEVTDENIKESKKLLANLNKVVKQLNDRRIAIKKEILEPYDIFAGQIKSIETVIKDADSVVRGQVRDLEEKERLDKKAHIEEIWNMRIGMYEYAQIFNFDDFIQAKHLNKTASMKSVEEEMVDFLEKAEKDIKLLSTMEDSKSLIRLYKDEKDVATVVEINKAIREEENKQTEKLENEGAKANKSYIFRINDEKDAKLAEMLLKENCINFTKEII